MTDEQRPDDIERGAAEEAADAPVGETEREASTQPPSQTPSVGGEAQPTDEGDLDEDVDVESPGDATSG